MGLQRIFSATTIVVGIFITVDYGLCDEFRCRGYEREKISDDSGPWNGENHALWTTVYIAGLAIFAAYFTLLDRYVLTCNNSVSNYKVCLHLYNICSFRMTKMLIYHQHSLVPSRDLFHFLTLLAVHHLN